MFKRKLTAQINTHTMNKNFALRAGNKVAMYNRKNNIITIETFFPDISSEEDFKGYHNALDENGVFYLKLFIDQIEMGANINISPRVYKDRFGVEYVYVNLRYRTGGGERYKVICFPGFEKFRLAMMTTGIKVTYNEIITKLGLNQDSELETP